MHIYIHACIHTRTHTHTHTYIHTYLTRSFSLYRLSAIEFQTCMYPPPHMTYILLLQIICHGIPYCRPIADGDVVNLDVTVYVEYKGKCYHGDLNEVLMCCVCS